VTKLQTISWAFLTAAGGAVGILAGHALAKALS
jgi:hypothetical protein